MKLENVKKRAIRWLTGFGTMLYLTAGNVAMATDTIGNSDVGKGLVKLIGDVTTFLLVLSPSIGVVMLIYCLIRKSASDPSDHRQWDKRISTVVICAIGATLASALFKLIAGYFTTT